MMMNMFKSTGALLVYNASKMNRKVALLLFGLFVIVTFYLVVGLTADSNPSYYDPETDAVKEASVNIWNSAYGLYSENIMFSLPIFLLCMYGAYCSFKKDAYEDKAKMRAGSYLKYIQAKLLFTFLFNTLVCAGAFLSVLVISAFFFDIQWNWGAESELFYPYMGFYSVWRFMGITLVTYIVVLTCLSHIFGIILTKLKHHLIGPIMILGYFLFEGIIVWLDPMLEGAKFAKLLCMSTYLLIGQRKLFADDIYSFLTVNMGILLPVAGYIAICVLIFLALKFRILREG
jgi:magnesium-transporting ATPase (P-type)